MTSKTISRFLLPLLVLCGVLSSTASAQSTNFSYTGLVVTYTIPVTGNYQFTVAGAAGGSISNSDGGQQGGNGAVVVGTIYLTSGTVLDIAVGGLGGSDLVNGGAGGGGGGTFIYTNTSVPLMVAGGGGGGDVVSVQNGSNGVTNSFGTAGGGGATGGTNGNGGSAGAGGGGGGGAGFLSSGQNASGGGQGGTSATNFAGGTAGPNLGGGFGGGGASGIVGGGGGGGYSGGGGGAFSGGAGGGGGSYVSGSFSNVSGTNGANSGNGYFSLINLTPSPANPTFYWATNTQSWAVATNWSSNQVPVFSNNAFIDNGGTAVLTNAGSVGTLTIASSNASSGTLYISNGGTLTVSTNLIIGSIGAGTVTIARGGSLISSNITIASSYNSVGILNVGTYGGGDTNVTFGVGTVTFGSGSATLNFNQSGILTNNSLFSGTSGTNSQIVQQGSGTTILTGVGGTNSANILVKSGTLTFRGAIFNDSYGNLYMNGGSSLLLESNSVINLTNRSSGRGGVWVGYRTGGSSNTMTITSGSQLNMGWGGLSLGAGGDSNSILITGIGSKADAGYGTFWSYNTGNTVTVQNGAVLIGSTNRSYADQAGDVIGYMGTNNRVIISGTGSVYTNNDSLNIGAEGASFGNQLIVTNGGKAVVGLIYLGDQIGDIGNSVVVYGNSTLTVSSNTYIGYGGAISNSVTVTGTNALWTNGTNVYIGYGNGSGSKGNSLVITNAGTVSALGYFQVGYTNGDTGNSVTVTGTNSRLIVDGSYEAYFDIGYQGDSNSMLVSDGAQVILNNRVNVGHGSADYPHTVGSSGNTLIVTGPGTLLSNSGRYLDIGDWTNSTGNLMVVSNQATVFNTNILYIGYDTASSNNSVIVTGTNSHLINGGDLDLGDYGSANTLVISNGATASFAGTSYISYYAGSSNNSVLVKGAGSVWSNSSIDLAHSGSGSITIASGGTVIAPNITIASQDGSVGVLNVGTYGGSDTNVTFGVGTVTFNNGTGTINFNQRDTIVIPTVFNGVTNTTNFNIVAQLGSGTTVITGRQIGTNGLMLIANGGLLTFSNAVYSSSNQGDGEQGSVYIGYQNGEEVVNFGYPAYSNSTPASMLITSNSVVSAHLLEIGYGYPSTNQLPSGNSGNRLTVNDSILILSGSLKVGPGGDSNSLVLTNGGTISSRYAYVGIYGNGNTAIIDGLNTSWTNSGNFYVGYSYGRTNSQGGIVGVGNSMVVSNGASVYNDALYLGNYSMTNGFNTMQLTGLNSTVSNSLGFTIGAGENRDSIIVSNGAKLFGNGDYIGSYNLTPRDSGNSNTIVVTGTNSLYSNAGNLYVGYSANGNSMVVSDKAQVTNAGRIYVGYQSDGNSVLISSNARVNLSDDLDVGYRGGSSNSVLVTGNGSSLTSLYSIYVGNGQEIAPSVGNSLVISNGANVTAYGGETPALVVGSFLGDVSNTVSVFGNSSLTIHSSSYIGSGDASENSMTVTGSNALWTNAGSIFIGYGSTNGSSNNSLTVTAGGRVLSDNSVTVGALGSGNLLVVSNGGSLEAAYGIDIGNNQGTNSLSNTVIVTGTNSSILAPGGVWLGDGADQNLLIVSNSAKVVAGGGYVGDYNSVYNDSGHSNTMIITGAGSLLSNSSSFWIGDGSSGNSLIITNGGRYLGVGNVQVGDSAGSNNTLLLSGNGSLLSNAETVFVGDSTSVGNSLNLNDAAAVFASNIVVAGGNTLTGNGTITTVSGTLLNGGTFAPTGTNILHVSGNLTFTNSAIYLWSLYGNTTNASGFTNFTAPVTLTNGALTVTSSTFSVDFGTNVNFSDAFWNSAKRWTVMNGTNVSGGNAFNLAFTGNTNGADEGRFALQTVGNTLYLTYNYPYIWNTNTQPWTNPSFWESGLVPQATNLAYINNGGTAVLNTNGFVGTLTIAGTNASSGTLLITNQGVLTVTDTLFIGKSGQGTVTIASGGSLNSPNIMVSGVSGSTGVLNFGTFGARDTRVSLGAGTVTFGFGNGTVNFNQAGTLTNSSTFISQMDWSFMSSRTINQNGSGTTVLTGSASSNQANVFVYAGELVFSGGSFDTIGYITSEHSSNASIVVNNGAIVSVNQFEIGSSSEGSKALISGSNTILTTSLDIGRSGGTGNNLTIANGATVIGNGDTIGGGNSNSLIVTSLGSLYTNSSSLEVGDGGILNSFSILNGARGYVDGTLTVGYYVDSNSLLVSGENSHLTYGDYLYIGDENNFNSLVVSNGAKLTGLNSYDAYLGAYDGNYNTALVTGPGSVWSNSGVIQVGDGGVGNRLMVSNGGSIIADGEIVIESGNTLAGNGTVTSPAGISVSGNFAPTGTNVLTVNGNLDFSGGTYLWNLFANSTNDPLSGVNYSAKAQLNGLLSVSNASIFSATFGNGVNILDTNFWGVSRMWPVMTGTNPASIAASTNFTLSISGPLPSVLFGITNISDTFYLSYAAPLITNVPVPAGQTNTLPEYTNTTVVIHTGGGTTYLGSNNPGLVGTIVQEGTLIAPSTNSFATNGDVTVNGGTLGLQGEGTTTVNGYLQTGGNLSGGSNATFWAANYVFKATNPASVGVNLDNLGTVVNYHSTAIVTTNASGLPVAPVVFNTDMGYDGGTVITGGILQLGSSNSSGPVSIQGDITNNGYLNYGYNGASTTPTNLVIGGGVIGQVGTGTLTVGSVGVDYQFYGSFASANGTLAITTNSALGSATNYYLADNGTLQATTDVTQITQSINVTNGTGVVENSSGSTLALDGTLTKSGSVLVLAGGDFTVNGQVTGSGAPGSFNSDLVLSNATAILNAGNNNYTGPTRVVAGSSLTNGVDNALPVSTVLTVGGAGDGFVVNRYDLNGYDQTIAGLSSAGTGNNLVTNGSVGLKTLTINGSTNTTYAGIISGNLALIRSGNGAITLTQNNTYTGGTTINSGKIVTTANTALGTGTVALNGGTLEVRSLLNIGAMTWSGGKVALPTLTSFNGTYLVSTNGLTLTNSAHIFNLTGARLTIGKATPLLGATNMNAGTFSTNQFSVEGVSKYSLTISNDILWIDLLGNPTPIVPTEPAYPNFLNYAVNRNQSNVASALNGFTNGPNADQIVVLKSLTALTNNVDQMQQAFNAIMPNFYQQMSTIAFNSANAQNMELSQRLWGLRLAEGGGFSMSGLADNYAMLQEGQGDGPGKGVLDAKKDILRPGLDNRWGMFVDGNGIFAQANSGNMLPGYKSQSGGITTGLTYKWNKSFASGIYAGYQGTYNKSGAAGSGLGVGSTLIDNAVRFGLFGTYGNPDGKGFYANALAGGGYNNYQASRIIEYPGMNRTANSSPGAGELDTMLGGGYDVQKGNFTFGPTASLQYTYLGVNGVNETGAQSLNFNSGGWNSSSMLSSVGAHAAYTWYAHKDIVVVPQVSLNWQHEFMQNPYAITGTLGGNSPVFSNWSAPGIRDYLYTGVGFTVEFAKRWNTSFFYNAVAGNQNLTSQNIFWSAGLKF